MAHKNELPLLFHLPWYKVEESCRGQTMAEIAGWGVRQLVVPQYFYHSNDTGEGGFVKQMNDLARGHGICFAAAHGLLGPQNDMGCASPQALAEHRRFLAQLSATEVSTYAIHSGALHPVFAEQKRLPEVFWRNVQNSLEKLLPVAEQAGITLALENIYEPWPVLERLVLMVESINHPRLGLCLDVGHANVNAAGLAEILPLLAPRMVTCHLHDNDGQQDQHAAPGQGTVRWPWLLEELGKVETLLHTETETRQFSLEIWRKFQHALGAIAAADCVVR